MLYMALFPILSLITPLNPQVLAHMEVVPIEEKIHVDHKPLTIKCSCVRYAELQGAPIPIKDARDIVPATTTPYIGGAVLEYYPHSGEHHVAYITDVSTTTITVREANYVPCEIGTRVIPRDSKRIVGFL